VYVEHVLRPARGGQRAVPFDYFALCSAR
jgi:hypothetical protein